MTALQLAVNNLIERQKYLTASEMIFDKLYSSWETFLEITLREISIQILDRRGLAL